MNYSVAQLTYVCVLMMVAGVIHMVLIKLPVLNSLLAPVDAGITLRDGKRLFGDNKTWKGFISMPLGGLVGFGLNSVLGDYSDTVYNLTIVGHESGGIAKNAWIFGAFLGLGYVVAELPNSFIKRRIDIAPGANKKGLTGRLFLVIDQIDSSIGCAIAMAIVLPLTSLDVVVLAVIGGVIHYVANISLYFVGLKKQMG